jgi:hypothetical protein
LGLLPYINRVTEPAMSIVTSQLKNMAYST